MAVASPVSEHWPMGERCFPAPAPLQVAKVEYVRRRPKLKEVLVRLEDHLECVCVPQNHLVEHVEAELGKQRPRDPLQSFSCTCWASVLHPLACVNGCMHGREVRERCPKGRRHGKKQTHGHRRAAAVDLPQLSLRLLL
ncbi:hypothetical protein Z043_122623 [Scleropages formosus]|uniref:Platelet-derived growth factor (PDGF) family profile domain-containing protein n=1 Tax=Scleropages formosus TaxID=113540 RepID=A0A0P7TZA4_SCLFO|nr:hypothetical protein Z043_122623 [Scleropages formosus]